MEGFEGRKGLFPTSHNIYYVKSCIPAYRERAVVFWIHICQRKKLKTIYVDKMSINFTKSTIGKTVIQINESGKKKIHENRFLMD